MTELRAARALIAELRTIKNSQQKELNDTRSQVAAHVATEKQLNHDMRDLIKQNNNLTFRNKRAERRLEVHLESAGIIDLKHSLKRDRQRIDSEARTLEKSKEKYEVQKEAFRAKEHALKNRMGVRKDLIATKKRLKRSNTKLTREAEALREENKSLLQKIELLETFPTFQRQHGQQVMYDVSMHDSDDADFEGGESTNTSA